MGMWRDSHRRIPPIGFFLVEIRGLDHAEGTLTGLMVASGGALSEGYGDDGPGVCQGDGQTEAGRAMVRRTKPYLSLRKKY